MSLTSHLADANSPVRKFLADEFPQTQQYIDHARSRLRLAGTLSPDGAVPWNIIGRAIDYRIRYYFDVTDWDEFAAYAGQRLLTDFSDGPALSNTGFVYKRTGNEINWYDRGTNHKVAYFIKSGDGHGYGVGHNYGVVGDDDFEKMSLRSDDVFAGTSFYNDTEYLSSADGDPLLNPPYGDFFRSLSEATHRLKPVGRRLTASEEDELCLNCITLGLLETAYRTGEQDNIITTADPKNLSSLFSIVKQNWIEDLRNLSWRFYDRYSRLLEFPAVLNPEFVYSHMVQGADADLIVNGMLIDIKTTIRPRLEEDWIWQLLGYVLLDRFDQHEIRHVGLYMARQGILIWWELDEMIGLSGKSQSVEELRERFFEDALNPLRN